MTAMTDSASHRARRAVIRAVTGLALVLALGGCAVLLGAGAAVGVAAYDERGVDGVARDLRLHARILEAWFQKEHTMPASVFE